MSSLSLEQRKERFTELMTTIELLPDNPEQEDFLPLFPKGSLGLSDGRLKTAVLTQALKENEQFCSKLLCTLVTTGMNEIKDSDKPTDDSLSALTLAVHLGWAMGAFQPMARILGLMASILDNFDVEMPEDVTFIFRPNVYNEERLSKLDAVKLLEVNDDDLLGYFKELATQVSKPRKTRKKDK